AQLSSLDLRKLGKPVKARRLGSTFNLASKTLARDRQFMRTILRISLCIFLTMVVLSGAIVSWDTSRSYLDRAMPSNVLIVGHAPIVDQYSVLGKSYSGQLTSSKVDFLNYTNLMLPQTVDKFRAIPGVQTVDARLLDFDNVTGYVKAHFADTGSLS